MNNNDKDLEAALDDIFGSDFIEIDVNKSKENEELSNNVSELDMVQFENSNSITYTDQIKPPVSPTFKKDEKDTDNLIYEVGKTQDNIDVAQPANNKEKTNDVDNKEPKERGVKGKKIIIWCTICFVLILLVIFILVNYVFGVQKVVQCSSSAEDSGYKYIDEYKITYKKDVISYIEGDYTYTVLSDDFKSEVDLIKQKKLLAIINSNGMPGFTYIYETGNNYFSVESYLDFTMMEFDKIDKINQDELPLSYFKITSKTGFKTLKQEFEKQGYKCVPSK